MPNILIVDDNKQISNLLCEYCKKENYSYQTAFDGEEALLKFSRDNFDVVLLDVMMPKKDGFEVCREIRKTSNLNVIIIMITARDEDFEKIMGLDNGADDYIVKPFSPSEVMARIRSSLRRIQTKKSCDNNNILDFDNLSINLSNYSVEINKTKIVLTKKEIELLWTLAKSPDQVFSRDILLNTLWGYDYYGDTRTVDSHIKRLRAKLDSQEHKSWEIRTIWGVGYKFEKI